MSDHRPLPRDGGRREGALPESGAWNIVSYLLAGMLGFGVPGYLLDRATGLGFLTPVGLLVGMAAALTIIWFRYGTDRSPDGPR